MTYNATSQVWELLFTQTERRAIFFIDGGGGGGGENFNKQTFLYMKLLLQTICLCLRLPANTLFYFYAIYFNVYSLIQNSKKDTKWEEKVPKNAQFPFCRQTKAFRYMKLSFEGFNHVFFTAERLACFEPTIRQ